MISSSPLRYPGGKLVLANLLSDIRRFNQLGGTKIAEPFAGGAGAALHLLFREDVKEICINDADPAIFAFWWSITHRSQQFSEALKKAPITIREWKRQRDIYRDRRAGRFRRGFAAFYLNRANRSGIIVNGGPVGGLRQEGEWKLDARFNKETLRGRLQKIADYRDRIEVSCLDGIDFIKSVQGQEVFLFIDPPYFDKGPQLYMNLLDPQYHTRLAKHLRSINVPWVLTYDDCQPIRDLYASWSNVRPFQLSYAAKGRTTGREVLITPRSLALPPLRNTNSLKW